MGRRIRNLQRYREITIAFSRNGFNYLVRDLGLYEIVSIPKRLFLKEPKTEKKSTGERLRHFLEELGPTFVKLGQLASTRPDLLPPDIIKELEKLQDGVKPFSYDEVKEIIEEELDKPVEDVFKEFHKEPLGSASIGQVHYAVLTTGEKVAVKIQRPSVEKIIQSDLEILHQLAVLAESRVDWAARYRLKDIVKEFSKAIIAELDYTVEGRNADRISKQFQADPTVYVPHVYWEHSTKKILTMEYLKGTKLKDYDSFDYLDKKVLAERIANSYFHQVLLEGFFHGDPHPGNISVLPTNVIGFMDFGMVGRLSPEMQDHFASLVIAVMRKNTEGVIRAIDRMGLIPDETDMQQLHLDVDEVREKYYDVPLSQVSLGDAINDLFSIAHKHQILIPTDLTLLGKTLLTVESIVEKLDPEMSIIHIAEPYGKQLLMNRLHPNNIASRIAGEIGDYGESLITLPKQLKEITEILKKGKLPVEISVPKVDLFLTKLDRISNRLSFSIVLLSFSIIMVGLIIGSALGGQSSVLWNVPAIEIGFIVALLMFLGLLYSIFKSGRF
ncbi:MULTISPECIES: ABC1 kinase family protein [Bacillaceae]|uniref:AarF/ABC1/UbiB kinase family protein n=1 Tax=Evansella alkalicola TaxID=745819 RepID=A0ABS6JNG5_9BACI|nr:MULTISPECIES: AarF/ABC1/UbiB kinase family protein [Bacillaceae]MBU9720018.1 AarF/ABC1/UbiB kinase family protein [Bacillus alkalicola]